MNDPIEAYRYDMLTLASKYSKLGESRAALEHAEIMRKLKGGNAPEAKR